MKRRIGLLAAWFALAGLAEAVEFKDMPADLAQVKRIYVDQLGGGRASDQIRDMIIAALQNSKLFAITENQDRADAILRGSADDKIYEEVHDTSDSIGCAQTPGRAAGPTTIRAALRPTNPTASGLPTVSRVTSRSAGTRRRLRSGL